MSDKEPDWKFIAQTLAQRVVFAISNLKSNGSGMLFMLHTGESMHWKNDFADALELIPGLKIDRDAMHGIVKKKKAKKEATK